MSVVNRRTPVDLSLKSQERRTQVRALGMLSLERVQNVKVCGLGVWERQASSEGTHGGIRDIFLGIVAEDERAGGKGVLSRRRGQTNSGVSGVVVQRKVSVCISEKDGGFFKVN